MNAAPRAIDNKHPVSDCRQVADMIDTPDVYIMDHSKVAAQVLNRLVQQSMERQGQPRAFIQQLTQLPPVISKAKQVAVTLLTVECVPDNALSAVDSSQWLSTCVPP
jgi:hypothetical protein